MLLALAAVLLLGAALPQSIPFSDNESISPEGQLLGRSLLEDGSVREMFEPRPLAIFRVTLEDVEVASERQKVFHYKGYTWFGIPWVRAEVRYQDGAAAGGDT